ncbi:MAG: hypothetical protein M1834_008160 [Cirrosporium novae-zelandiae]|nr:MAG: hypothetical protein M1834_008160 [Cirrosporium novae-zelandiae]
MPSFRPSGCQLYNFIAPQGPLRRTPVRAIATYSRSPAFLPRPLYSQAISSRYLKSGIRFSSTTKQSRISSTKNLERNTELDQLAKATKSVLQPDTVPSEESCLDLLRPLESLTARLVDRHAVGNDAPTGASSPTSALLSLEEDGTRVATTILKSDIEHLTQEISQLADDIILHPNVFISPEILETYINIQASLRRPKLFPLVFDLYATKPIPKPNSYPVKYKNQNPKSVKVAIPISVAQKAINTAISVRNLPLALSVIDTSFGAPAFQRSKLIRKASIPICAAIMAPVVCYSLATQVAHFQTALEVRTATNLAFAAIFAYVGFTSIIGYVAFTTANDQMIRVTWVDGTALWERWAREEERAALDRVAMAWGFKDIYRRGEEEGPEWDDLRLYIREKSMVLDRTSLLEGME